MSFAIFAASVMTSIPAVPLPRRIASNSWSLKAGAPLRRSFSLGRSASGIWSMALLMPSRSGRKMVLDDGYRHDVEDAARAGVFWIGQFLITPSVVIGRLNLAIDLPAICALKI